MSYILTDVVDEIGQRLVKWTKPKGSPSELSMLDYALAGGFSAIPTTVVTTPMVPSIH